jgi:N-acetylmuramic acid 6-phosphate etherase
MRSAEPVTEQRRPEHADLDLRPTRELVELINDEDYRVAPAVRIAAADLAAAIDDIVARLARGGRLIYVGAGTSGRLAEVDADECIPTFGIATGQVLAVAGGGLAATEDDADTGAGDLLAAAGGIGSDDAVVVLSASGTTPYALGAARVARDAGALVVCVCSASGSPLGKLADREIVVLVGPEIVAGSTRMKAGTAQKLVLNTISTVAMIQLGKTFGNLMVGVVAGNEKLRERARRTVELATGGSAADVAAALAAADGDVKVAIVSLLAGVGAGDAHALLAAAGGSVRGALAQRALPRVETP